MLICIITILQVLILINFAFKIDFQNIELLKFDLLNYFCFTVFPFVSLIIPLYHSNRFQQLMHNIITFNNILNDSIYSELLLRKQKSLTKVVSLLCVCKLIVVVVCIVLDVYFK